MNIKLVISGYGGQGALSAGKILSHTAILEDKYTTWLPSYGAEMRGGTANCTVVISDSEISTPYVEKPTHVIALNKPSLTKFEKKLQPKGFIIVNSSIVEIKGKREDINYLYLPFNDISEELGNLRSTNILAVGAFIQLSNSMSIKSAQRAVENILGKKKEFIEINKIAIEKGADLVKNYKN